MLVMPDITQYVFNMMWQVTTQVSEDRLLEAKRVFATSTNRLDVSFPLIQTTTITTLKRKRPTIFGLTVVLFYLPLLSLLVVVIL